MCRAYNLCIYLLFFSSTSTLYMVITVIHNKVKKYIPYNHWEDVGTSTEGHTTLRMTYKNVSRP
jgi:hypothetical protein